VRGLPGGASHYSLARDERPPQRFDPRIRGPDTDLVRAIVERDILQLLAAVRELLEAEGESAN